MQEEEKLETKKVSSVVYAVFIFFVRRNELDGLSISQVQRHHSTLTPPDVPKYKLDLFGS